ncbi:WbuC family cupin fold metalloprotein [Propionivibrio dicarboxylicus]|nr:WbuC family cupin fold metalloprotein [Propionivibrio dicarboxylicus]
MIDHALLTQVCSEAASSPRGRKNFNFHGDNADPAHRLLNAFEPGSYVVPHRHLDAAKDETILVLRGVLGLVIFDDDGGVVQATALSATGPACGVDIPHGVYHTVFACVPETVMFESKGGPFMPLSSEERAPWAPAEGSDGATAYLRTLMARVDGR